MNLAGISFALIICSNLRSSQQGNLRAACYSLTISRRRVWARRQLLRGAKRAHYVWHANPKGIVGVKCKWMSLIVDNYGTHKHPQVNARN